MPMEAIAERSVFEDGENFLDRVSREISFAYQPIIDIHTGTAHGYEALIRRYEAMGFRGIFDLFDQAWSMDCLHRLDLLLRKKAITGFSRIDRPPGARLFYNLDQRILASPDYQPKKTGAILEECGLRPELFCLELSERHEIAGDSRAVRLIEIYRKQFCRLAIDNFGAGYSGLKLLYHQQPDIVKIDRHFISGLSRDNKKMLFVSTIVNLAHVLGITVVAEGVETEAELLSCRKIGCDLVQGYLVCRPTDQLELLKPVYHAVAVKRGQDRRHRQVCREMIVDQVVALPPLRIDDSIHTVFEAFLHNSEQNFFPVIDRSGEPVGIVRDRDFKRYVYSPFGKDLISNRALGRTIRDFIRKCPIADVNMEADRILEIFSMGENPEGVVMVKDSAYAGFLSAASLLLVVNARNLAQAQDQNPLTRLPGNASIGDYVAQALDDDQRSTTLVYFDFDNFKPFNDAYGFRQGDRAILLFSELMRKKLASMADFLGHVGGDDFFAGFGDHPLENITEKVARLLESFANDVESFYDAEARQMGKITARDREGNLREFHLLTCSAAVIRLPKAKKRGTVDEVTRLFAELKKEAKNSSIRMAVATMEVSMAQE